MNNTSHAYAKAITKVLGGEFLDSDNMLYRWVNDEWIGKYSVQTKDLRHVWFEEVKPEDINTKHYNLDGTKK